jgi:P4 family phage/plasmid primase-like protien
LRRRGLPDAESYKRGYRLLPDKGKAKLARQVVASGLEQHLPGVPGFVVNGYEGHRYWTISAWGAGLLIPVRDPQGRIVALKTRALSKDGAEGGKYRYLSSKKRGGAGPGSPLHFPLFDGDKTTVRVTEGELKADIATALTGVFTLSIPGVGAWRRVAKALRELGAKIVRLAFDADASTNRTVATALYRLARRLRKLGFAVELERWALEDGKGIDDLLAAGKEPELLKGKAAMAAIKETLKAAEQADPLPTAEMLRSGFVEEADNDPHRLARLILDQGHSHQDGKTLRFHRSLWYRWDGTAYKTLPDTQLRAEVNAAIKREFDSIAKEKAEKQAKSAEGDDKGPPKAMKVTTGLVTNVIEALQSMTLVRGDIDPPAWLGLGTTAEPRNYIALSNGIVDLSALLRGDADALRPHSPLWFSTVCLPYAYDSTAGCPKWLRFLERNLEGDAERIEFLQQWFGYSLTSDTGQQKFLVMEGEGANGKSVLCAVLTAALGEGNVSHVPLEGFGQRFQLADTLGKLANVCSEVGELDRVAEGFLKQFTSGDRMQFEQKFKPPIKAIPTAKLVLSTNNRPRFSDRSGGLWRRMVLLPLRVTIPKPDRVKNMDKPWWWVESGELPGIFNWAVEGLRHLQQHGDFVEPSLCRDALEEYRTENNPARAFLEETCQADPEGVVRSEDLYRTYRDWCTANGYYPLGSRAFGKEVVRVFRDVKRVQRGTRDNRFWAYCGLRIGPPEDIDLELG